MSEEMMYKRESQVDDDIHPRDVVGGSEKLRDREQSGFPVSIGTGLCLETLFDPVSDVIDDSRDVKKMTDFDRYDLYIINIETLIRNLLSSIDTELLMSLAPKDVYETIVDEMDFITYIFKEHGLRVEFYYNTYQYYKDLYKDSYRHPSTPKQQYTMELTGRCLKEVGKAFPEVKKFDQYLSYGSDVRALVLTHIPADLLSYDKFRILDLLESHTGAIKSREEFNTKYYPVPREDMSFLPFFEYLLVTFGDKVMFKPKPIKKRKEVLDSLKRLKVHPLMSEYSLGLQFAFK